MDWKTRGSDPGEAGSKASTHTRAFSKRGRRAARSPASARLRAAMPAAKARSSLSLPEKPPCELRLTGASSRSEAGAAAGAAGSGSPVSSHSASERGEAAGSASGSGPERGGPSARGLDGAELGGPSEGIQPPPIGEALPERGLRRGRGRPGPEGERKEAADESCEPPKEQPENDA